MSRKFESDLRWDATNEDHRPAWSVVYTYDWNLISITESGRWIVSVPNCTQEMAENILSVPGAVVEVFDA